MSLTHLNPTSHSHACTQKQLYVFFRSQLSLRSVSDGKNSLELTRESRGSPKQVNAAIKQKYLYKHNLKRSHTLVTSCLVSFFCNQAEAGMSH